ncbi:hypothetical protein BJ138DRAFT_1152321 [Hygrophoropsis aurantiaca]|uniref:Uncharacterized protein n=1 Tax=Hygrophoropsis aurantiaca TaxID=72124 RepID=A0ACB8AB76_9AGAM|nr:hypothetical protein BJ138DRAFT_1152321 [Hygrophoropsis aurantiaca]
MDVDELTASSPESYLLSEPAHGRTLRKRPNVSEKSSLRFNPISTAHRGRSGASKSYEDAGKVKSFKHPPLSSAAKGLSDREARVREMKKRALAIPSTGKTPATIRQRLVMQMVYNEITPYPDEAWVSQMGIIINREYHQVKNWFSNQRQKDARESRHTSQATPPSDSTLSKITCEGRELRLRTFALETCTASDWSDSFFDEVVMIHNFRLLVKHSQDDAKVAESLSSADSIRDNSP